MQERSGEVVSRETADEYPHNYGARGASAEAKHVLELDGLRAIAIALVMAFHFGRLRSGWMGVDLFFVLSGFLITGICLDHRGPRFYIPFYGRRVLRILPPYTLAIAIVALILPLITKRPPHGLFWLATFTTNVGASTAGTWDAIPKGSLHFWSLAVEEQFYVLWPLTVAVLSTNRLALVAAAAVPLALGIRAWLLLHGASWIAAYTLTPARMDTLALGALLAIAYRTRGVPSIFQRLGNGSLWAWIGGLVAVSFGVALVSPETDQGGGIALQTIGYSVIALLATTTLASTLAADPSSGLRTVLRHPALRSVGRLSYGMYLFHVPLRDAVLSSGLTLPTSLIGRCAVAALLSVITYGLAALSWRLAEQPALALKRYFPYERQAARGVQ